MNKPLSLCIALLVAGSAQAATLNLTPQEIQINGPHSADINSNKDFSRTRLTLEEPWAPLPADTRWQGRWLTAKNTPAGGELTILGAPGWRTQMAPTRSGLQIQALAEKPKPRSAEPRLSLDFQQIEVRSALQILADFSGKNIVAADNVSGTVALRLQRVRWQDALEAILLSKQLGSRQVGDILWVAPEQSLQDLANRRLKLSADTERMAPLELLALPIQYARASDLASLLQSDAKTTTMGLGSGQQVTGGLGLLSERGSARADVRSNTLLLRDTPEQLAQIKTFIARMDKPQPQVQIEARIALVDRKVAEAIGVRWGGNYQQGKLQVDGGANGAPAVSLPAAGLAGFAPATLGIKLGEVLGSELLDLQLSALESNGRGAVLSRPRITTSNGETATIEQGTEIPYQEATSSGATAVSFKKAALTLTVTPRITPDGFVQMQVQATKDAKGEIVPGGVSINTQRIQTQVRARDNETLVLGGIVEQENSAQQAGVPGLQRIPLIGNLFKNRSTANSQRELLIFLTPRIIR